MTAEPDVTILYVARGIDAGLAAATAFAEAWLRHPPGHAYRLLFLAKGWPSASDRTRLADVAAGCGAGVLDVNDDGFDWGAYFQALPCLGTHWVCLMNSHSRPLSSDWLAKLMAVATRPEIGVAGATGSWESPRGAHSRRDSFATRVRQLLRAVRHQRHLRNFEPYPNPHLRSTGILVSRELLQSFAALHGPPGDKYAAHMLESGRNGLTRFAQRRGCQPRVVGRDGCAYAVPDWPASATFRSLDQRNLLISDNRTRDYEVGTPAVRAALTSYAWGASPPAQASATSI